MALGDNNLWDSSGDSRGRQLPAGSNGPFIVDAGPIDGFADWSTNDGQGEGFGSILEYWRLLAKHRFVIAITLAAALAFGVAATLLMQPIYTATTTLQIDREAAKVLDTQDVKPSESLMGGEEFFQTQYGLLKSRSLATRVVEDLNLGSPEFLEAMGSKLDEDPAAPSNSAAARKAAAVRLVMSNLSVDPVRGSRLVRVTFKSPDPALSARLANAVAENFIRSNLDRRFESSKYARDFLEQRLKVLKPRLEDSERQLVAYAAQQQIINVPTSEGTGPAGATQSLTASNLVALNSALATAKGERIAAEQRWRQTQSAPGMGLPQVLSSPTIQQLSQSRAELSATYQEKLSVYKPDFPAMVSLKAQIDEVDRQIQVEIGHIKDATRSQYNTALSQERALSGQVEQLKSSFLDLRDRSIQYTILQREVDTNRAQYEALLQRYKDVTVAGGVVANNISVVDMAEPPTRPSSPKLLLNIGLAGIVGLGLGALMAFLLEMIDESIRTPEDVENKLGISLLGSVPFLPKGTAPAEALADIRSAFSEAYYSIRTALQFSTNNGAPPTLLVTSARPAEGKSTSAMAIAKSFARLDVRVLLVDGDLRNPSMHRNLGSDNSVGMSSVLTNASTLTEAVQGTDTANLWFIPCGPLPPNPAELLAGVRMRAFLAEAQAHYDIIVIDGPPVMGLADAPMLASMVAGTLLVIESGGTRRGLARAAVKRLRLGNGRIVGAILTKFDARKASYGYGSDYRYSYDYNYGEKPRLTEG